MGYWCTILDVAELTAGGGKLNCLCAESRCDAVDDTGGITPAVSGGLLSRASIENGLLCDMNAECIAPLVCWDIGEVNAELSPPVKTK